MLPECLQAPQQPVHGLEKGSIVGPMGRQSPRELGGQCLADELDRIAEMAARQRRVVELFECDPAQGGVNPEVVAAFRERITQGIARDFPDRRPSRAPSPPRNPAPSASRPGGGPARSCSPRFGPVRSNWASATVYGPGPGRRPVHRDVPGLWAWSPSAADSAGPVLVPGDREGALDSPHCPSAAPA